jgi:hypothetical protein
VHYSLLSGVRTVIVEQDMLPLTQRPDPQSPETALLEMGVVARLGECLKEWCKLTSGGYKGWAPKTALWGVFDNELRECPRNVEKPAGERRAFTRDRSTGNAVTVPPALRRGWPGCSRRRHPPSPRCHP